MGPRFDERGNWFACPCSPSGRSASMGPRFDERGNVAAGRALGVYRSGFNGAAVCCAPGGLQWGRASMSAEILNLTGDGIQRLMASMGPRFDERGNVDCQRQQHDFFDASMGPRFDERGNGPRNRFARHLQLASMG